MKVALFANSDWFIYQFCTSLAEALKLAGHEIVLIGPSGKYQKKCEELGLNWRILEVDRRQLNPIKELLVVIRLIKILREEQADILNNFTLKSVVYGSLSSLTTPSVKVVNTLTGLGYVYSSKESLARILRPIVSVILKFALRRKSSKTVVLNRDDLNLVAASFSLEINSDIICIPGSGVDHRKFKPADRQRSDTKIRKFAVCLPARLLADKGVFEFVEAAERLKKKFPEMEFHLAGGIDTGNPTAILRSQIESWTAAGVVAWDGHVDKMWDYFPRFDVVVLPSYREGLPTALTEACMCGIPVVASDVPGCRDVICDRKNGLLIKPRNVTAIENALTELYLDDDQRAEFGRNARAIAVKRFSADNVNSLTIQLYSSLSNN